MHSKCKPGDIVHVKVGGSFYLQPDVKCGLFIAGGVGITPIVSMVRHLRDIKHPFPFKLLYSVRHKNELLFKDELSLLPHQFYITRDERSPARLDSDEILAQIRSISTLRNTGDSVDVYVCGPPSFADHVLATVSQTTGIRVFHERWW
jgi:ferredoxin-NADP reductase